MDPINNTIQALSAVAKLVSGNGMLENVMPDPDTVSDAVKSLELDREVKLDLVGKNGNQTSKASDNTDETDASDPQFEEAVKKSVEKLNDELKQKHISLNFWVDEESESLVVQVLESESGKVIRQIPPDEILSLRRHLQEMTGIIFDADG